jgi:hypothetical protein
MSDSVAVQRPARFWKKPVVIEAMPFDGTLQSARAVAAWIRDNGGKAFASKPVMAGVSHIDIWTLEGTMRADEGDWIIRGVANEFYPCKPDIFEATYEPAES